MTIRDSQSSLSNLARKKPLLLIVYLFNELVIHLWKWQLQMGINNFGRFVHVQRPVVEWEGMAGANAEVIGVSEIYKAFVRDYFVYEEQHLLFLVNKINRCTEFQLYWYYYSTCFGQPFCPSSGVLSRTSAWDVCSSILLLVANGHHNCIKCTKADVRLRTPDDGQKGCPKHVAL